MPYNPRWNEYGRRLQGFYRQNPRAAAQYAQPGLGQGQASGMGMARGFQGPGMRAQAGFKEGFAPPIAGQAQAAPPDLTGFQRSAMGAGGFGVRPNNIPGIPAGVGGTLGELVSAPGGGGPVTLAGGRQMSGGDYDEYVRQREARRAGIRT